MAEEPVATDFTQIIRWTDPPAIQHQDIPDDQKARARRAFEAWRRYDETDDPSELIEMGILPASSANDS